METEYEIDVAEVPSKVKSTLDSAFTGYEIEGAEVTESASGKAYEFAL